MASMGSHQSKANDTDVWLTPPFVLRALGTFDLDPAACAEPRPWATARQHFTVYDNGLIKPWRGRVWLNPPYGQPEIIGRWMRRMADHGCGTALIFARTETELFFETVWRRASGCLFLEGRLTFHHPDGRAAKQNGGAPSVLVAYGEDDAAILRTCGLRGHFVPLDAGASVCAPAPASSLFDIMRADA